MYAEVDEDPVSLVNVVLAQSFVVAGIDIRECKIRREIEKYSPIYPLAQVRVAGQLQRFNHQDGFLQMPYLHRLPPPRI